MSFQLSIIIPTVSVPKWVYVASIALRKSFYDGWTASDYAYVYQDANETPFTWDDVHVPRRSSRLSAKKSINYKI